MHFGRVEAQCVLAMVARRFRLELAQEGDVKADPLLTLRPKGSVRVWLHRHRCLKELI
jgi:cytochrome P450